MSLLTPVNNGVQLMAAVADATGKSLGEFRHQGEVRLDLFFTTKSVLISGVHSLVELFYPLTPADVLMELLIVGNLEATNLPELEDLVEIGNSVGSRVDSVLPIIPGNPTLEITFESGLTQSWIPGRDEHEELYWFPLREA